MRPRISKARAEKATKPLKRGELAILNGDAKRIKQIEEFVDRDHAATDEYYEIAEQFHDGLITVSEVKATLKKLMKSTFELFGMRISRP